MSIYDTLNPMQKEASPSNGRASPYFSWGRFRKDQGADPQGGIPD